MRKEKKYRYLLHLYSQTDQYLANTLASENLPEMIVSFCICVEKIFKIRLFKKNPLLIFDNSKIKENDRLVSLVKRKYLTTETIRFNELLIRYKLMFPKKFSDEEIQVLIDIYNIRNHLLHSHNDDEEILSDPEKIIKKMGTVWEKISKEATIIFGQSLIKANKPRKKYSEEELESLLIAEVRKKIESTRKKESLYSSIMGTYERKFEDFSFNPSAEKCPRCDKFTFELESLNKDIYSPLITTAMIFDSPKRYSGLYLCNSCNLELTKKEYEIAKKINQETNY